MFQLQNGLKFIKGVRLRKSKRESKEGGGGGGGFTPDIRVLLPRHFYNSLSVCLFLEFELQLGKSEKLNNQEMKGTRDVRILFIPKKQLTIRQTLHGIFLKSQYKVCSTSAPYSSISTHSFSLFQKYLNLHVRTNKMVNSVVYQLCPSRFASRVHPFIFL